MNSGRFGRNTIGYVSPDVTQPVNDLRKSWCILRQCRKKILCPYVISILF
jgi:hypothetical protein